jgi:hypothetical protein
VRFSAAFSLVTFIACSPLKNKFDIKDCGRHYSGMESLRLQLLCPTALLKESIRV